MTANWTDPATLANLAGTTEDTILGLIFDGFIGPCTFLAPGARRSTESPLLALAYRMCGFHVITLIPWADAQDFLAMLPDPDEIELQRAA